MKDMKKWRKNMKDCFSSMDPDSEPSHPEEEEDELLLASVRAK